jgi:hypothetical protein
MSKQNFFSFRYYLFVHGQQPRLETHGETTLISHTSYDNMVQQVREYVDGVIHIPGSLTFQDYLFMREITRANYDHVVSGEDILVTIDIRNERHVGHGITTKSTNQDLMASLELLQRKLERLERSLLTR